MTYRYKAHGTCAHQIDIELNDDNTIADAKFYGGCDGNHKGIVALIKGQKIDDVIDRLQGIKCGFKKTSCPDQLAQALIEIKNSNN